MGPPPILHFPTGILETGSCATVQLTHVQDGPQLFFVQKCRELPSLVALMEALANAELDKLCWTKPAAGLAVIAVSSQDNRRYRAAIQDALPTECRVFYVDYGHSENVPYSQIFEVPRVPRTFLDRPAFAYRMQLSGWTQAEPIALELKVWFEQLLRQSDDLLIMVLASPGERLSTPHVCRLFDRMRSVENLLTTEKWNSFDVVLPY